MTVYDLIVIGGGPAGLAAAVKAYDCGVKNILIIERDKTLGGILNQCIHNGFGLHRFKSELTGPEYAERFINMVKEQKIQIMTDTMVLSLTKQHDVYVMGPACGCRTFKAKAIILAMGCRERTRGAIAIPGQRPAGIFTAGTAQRYINIEGCQVGRRAVILGSGDIGLIMARRLTLEGAKVLACIELMPYSSGLNRNIVQCLNDFGIPLYLSHTVVDIQGDVRVEKVRVAKVDENRQPIIGTEFDLDCDTLLLSVGLIPENELTRNAGIEMDRRTNGAFVYENMETSAKGIFACGNAVHVHDLVDYVSEESERAGAAAAAYIAGGQKNETALRLQNGEYVTYTVPQYIRPGNAGKFVKIFFRANKSMEKAVVKVADGSNILAQFNREYIAPGEMQSIILTKQLLEKASGDTVTVTLEEVPD